MKLLKFIIAFCLFVHAAVTPVKAVVPVHPTANKEDNGTKDLNVISPLAQGQPLNNFHFQQAAPAHKYLSSCELEDQDLNEHHVFRSRDILTSRSIGGHEWIRETGRHCLSGKNQTKKKYILHRLLKL